MMAVKNIVFNHDITLIGPYTSLGGVFQGPIYYYLLSIPTFLLGGDPWGAVVLMLLISLAVVAVSSFWMYRLFGLKAGLVTLVLFSLSPQAIAASTFSWNPHPMWLVISVFVFSFIEINLGRKKFCLLMWPSVALMFHFQSALGFFFSIASISYFLVFQRKLFLNKFSAWGISLAGLLFLPQILFELRHNFLMSHSVIELLKGNNTSLSVTGENLSPSSLFNDHLNTHRLIFRSAFPSQKFLDLMPKTLFLFTFISSLYFLSKNKFSKTEFIALKSLVTLFLIIFGFTMFYPFLLRQWFLTGFEVFYIVIFSIVLSKLLNFASGKVFLAALIFLMFAYSIMRTAEVYRSNDSGGVAKKQGKLEAIRYIHTDAKGEKYNLLIFTPPVYTFAYDYLIWWDSRKSGYDTPGNEKKGLTYLLMEPDPGQKDTYIGWLETVIINGKVLSEVKLSSGFIIQKRLFGN